MSSLKNYEIIFMRRRAAHCKTVNGRGKDKHKDKINTSIKYKHNQKYKMNISISIRISINLIVSIRISTNIRINVVNIDKKGKDKGTLVVIPCLFLCR